MSPVAAQAKALWSVPPMTIALCTQNRVQNVPGVAGTDSISNMLPEVPASVLAFTRSDEAPHLCWVVSTAKSRDQSPGAAFTA